MKVQKYVLVRGDGRVQAYNVSRKKVWRTLDYALHHGIVAFSCREHAADEARLIGCTVETLEMTLTVKDV